MATSGSASFSTSARVMSDAHAEESFEEFSARYVSIDSSPPRKAGVFMRLHDVERNVIANLFALDY
jgi:hypothetical protein